MGLLAGGVGGDIGMVPQRWHQAAQQVTARWRAGAGCGCGCGSGGGWQGLPPLGRIHPPQHRHRRVAWPSRLHSASPASGQGVGGLAHRLQFPASKPMEVARCCRACSSSQTGLMPCRRPVSRGRAMAVCGVPPVVPHLRARRLAAAVAGQQQAGVRGLTRSTAGAGGKASCAHAATHRPQSSQLAESKFKPSSSVRQAPRGYER